MSSEEQKVPVAGESSAKKEKQPREKKEKQPQEKKEKKPQEKKEKQQKEQQKPKENKGAKDLLGLGVKKDEDFSEWYTQAITKAELIEYYDISGCYIVRPWAYAIWEAIQEFFNAEIKKLGVQNAYFPLLVSERSLTSEKEHIEGFAPEVC